jgi:hypothetical protein
VPPVVETLLDIAQLRAVANKLGISQVSYKQGGFLMLKLDLKHMPDDVLFIQAMRAADKRFMPSTRQPDVILLAEPRANEYGMLEIGLKALTALHGRLQEMIREEDAMNQR